MEIRDLRLFVLSAKFLSFSKVAECLFMTQPTVSKCISNLENELGQPLFERTTHSMRLSTFGQRFLPYAQHVLDAESEAFQFVQSQSSLHQKYFSLGIANSLGMMQDTSFVLALESCVSALREEIPTLAVLAKSCPDQDILSSLQHRLLDVAFFPSLRQYAPKQSDSNIHCLELIERKNYLVYSPRLGYYDTAERLLSENAFISYLHDPVSEGILRILPNDFQCSTSTKPHENWTGLLVDVGEGLSVGIVSGALLEISLNAGFCALPLDAKQFETAIYMSYPEDMQFTTYINKLTRSMQDALASSP